MEAESTNYTSLEAAADAPPARQRAGEAIVGEVEGGQGRGAGREARRQGLEGVGMALQVLRDYYAEKDEAFIQGNKDAFLQGKMGLGESKHSKATGASTGIIGSLVVSVVGAVVLLWIVSKVKSKA